MMTDEIRRKLARCRPGGHVLLTSSEAFVLLSKFLDADARAARASDLESEVRALAGLLDGEKRLVMTLTTKVSDLRASLHDNRVVIDGLRISKDAIERDRTQCANEKLEAQTRAAGFQKTAMALELLLRQVTRQVQDSGRDGAGSLVGQISVAMANIWAGKGWDTPQWPAPTKSQRKLRKPKS